MTSRWLKGTVPREMSIEEEKGIEKRRSIKETGSDYERYFIYIIYFPVCTVAKEGHLFFGPLTMRYSIAIFYSESF